MLESLPSANPSCKSPSANATRNVKKKKKNRKNLVICHSRQRRRIKMYLTLNSLTVLVKK